MHVRASCVCMCVSFGGVTSSNLGHSNDYILAAVALWRVLVVGAAVAVVAAAKDAADVAEGTVVAEASIVVAAVAVVAIAAACVGMRQFVDALVESSPRFEQ